MTLPANPSSVVPAAMVIPAPLVYIKVVAVNSLYISPPSQEGLQAVQVLIPRQTVFLPQARKKWVSLVPAAMVIPAPLMYI